MGVSFGNRVLLICKEDEREWLDSLPKDKNQRVRLPGSHFQTDCPCWTQTSDDGKLIFLDSSGYGVYDLSDYIPNSLSDFISEVYSCQGQEIDYVEMVPWWELEEEEKENWDWEPWKKEDQGLFWTENQPILSQEERDKMEELEGEDAYWDEMNKQQSWFIHKEWENALKFHKIKENYSCPFLQT